MRTGVRVARSLFAGMVAAFCVAPSAARAHGVRVVRGVVIDTADRPVPSVTIQVASRPPVLTDDSGRFRLEIAHRDRVSFDVRRVGFLPSRFGLVAGGDTTIAITVFPTAQQLPTVDVTANEVDRSLDITGFNQRLRERDHGTNSGIFITAAEIEKRQPSRVTQLFEDLPGVLVCRTGVSGYVGKTCGLTGAHLIPNDNGPGYVRCPITVFLDGIRLNSRMKQSSDVDIDAFMQPFDIAGLEYYPSGNRLPSQFQLLNGSCGAVLVWTKRGA